jgi:hypothetical protein
MFARVRPSYIAGIRGCGEKCIPLAEGRPFSSPSSPFFNRGLQECNLVPGCQAKSVVVIIAAYSGLS